jgi:hypothetical protein
VGSGDLGARPDQDAAVLIHRHALALDEFGFQIFQIRVVELELPLESAIGQAPPPLEHGDRLVQELLKGHRPPSLGQYGVQKTVWELRCGNWRGRSGACIPHMVDKRKQEVQKRIA